MRLPIAKVYRAFPELDRFSDSECRSYIGKAMRNRAGSMIVASVVAVVLAVGVAFAAPALVIYLARSAGVSFSNRYPYFYPILGIAAFVAGPAIVAITVRNFWLRRAIRSQLNTTLCPGCGYQLLGLPLSGGALQCPECGRRSTLHELGVTSEMLMASGSPARPEPGPSHPPTTPTVVRGP